MAYDNYKSLKKADWIKEANALGITASNDDTVKNIVGAMASFFDINQDQSLTNLKKAVLKAMAEKVQPAKEEPAVIDASNIDDLIDLPEKEEDSVPQVAQVNSQAEDHTPEVVANPNELEDYGNTLMGLINGSWQMRVRGSFPVSELDALISRCDKRYIIRRVPRNNGHVIEMELNGKKIVVPRSGVIITS